MFFVKNRFWLITHEATSILRIPPNWKRAREICAAFCYKCLQSLFTLYVVYKQMRYYSLQQSRALPMRSCAVTVEEKQEINQRIEELECAMDGLGSLSTSEERLAEFESRITNLQQEIQRRIEALENSPGEPGVSEERLADLASQIADWQQGTHQRLEVLEGSLSRPAVSEDRLLGLESHITNLQQEMRQRIETLEGALKGLGASEERLAELATQVALLHQASPGSMPAMPGASPEERKRVLLTARGFAARHGVDWNQMQAWIDTQALTPALSPEGLSDYLLTPDQQSMLIRYWKARKIPYTPCEQCPHYVLFGP
jgi:predicted  nucleic acid-binding Zn-ribbon protein